MKDSTTANFPRVPLSDVASFVNGGTPKSKVAEYWGGDVQWLTPKDMGQMEGREISETPRTITQAGLKGSSARLVPAGSVILSTRAPIGHLAMNTVPMAFNQGCRGIIPSDKLDPVYLYHFLSMSRDLLNELGSGTTFKELSATNLKSVEIPLPPLEEQQRIVEVLDEAFEGLVRARAHSEANLENTSELFRNTLAQRTNSKDFPRVLLSEVCDVRDGTHDTPKYVDEGVPLVTQKNIRPEGLSLENVKLISHDDHIAIHRRSNVAEGDILISMIGVNRGMSCIVDRDDVFSIKNVGLIKETPKLNMYFLLYFLKSADAEKYVEEATNGGAQPFVGLGKLRAFPIPLPERAVQDRIATELTEMEESVLALTENYEAQIKDLDDLRQSLLQKAFAGELT